MQRDVIIPQGAAFPQRFKEGESMVTYQFGLDQHQHITVQVFASLCQGFKFTKQDGKLMDNREVIQEIQCRAMNAIQAADTLVKIYNSRFDTKIE